MNLKLPAQPPTEKVPTEKVSADKETGRIEAFSDGVFAIAITLLVLELRLPDPAKEAPGGLLVELGKLWPMYLAFTGSFFFILVMWINHHRLFTAIRRADNNLLLLNGLLLFGITSLPFPTAVAAEYLPLPERSTAVMVYSGWFVVIAIFFNILWRYASYKNRLFSAQTDPQLVSFITRQFSFGPLLYFVALLVAWFDPIVSLLISLALAVFYAVPNRAVQQLIEEESNERPMA